MTEYLDPTADEMWLRDRSGHCVWCGSEVTKDGCFCRKCDSCSEFWKDVSRHDFDDGRPHIKTCPECEVGEQRDQEAA